MKKTSEYQQKRYGLSWGVTGLIISFALIIGGIFFITTLLLAIPLDNRLDLLAIAMAGSGISTTLLAYGLYKRGLLQRLGQLRWTLVIASSLTISIVLINIWILSELMFVDNHYTSLTSVVLVFAGLSSLSFNFFISKALTDRLNQLTQGVTQLAEGNLNTRLHIDGNDEIAQLTAGFNQMAHNLHITAEEKQRLEKTRRDLIAWVSHDLRTPLTSMRVMLEALEDGVITDKTTQERYIANSLAEIKHLSHLIDDLFDIAQLDVGHIALNYETTSLPDLISDTISTMSASAMHKNIQLSGQVAPELDLIRIAPDKMQRVFYNIITNAIQYAPANAQINIKAYPVSARHLQIDINNTDSIIDEKTLPHIFESFYRSEHSRRRNDDDSRGTGLGLAIARGIVEAHNGRIWAESDATRGTTLRIQIPIQP